MLVSLGSTTSKWYVQTLEDSGFILMLVNIEHTTASVRQRSYFEARMANSNIIVPCHRMIRQKGTAL